MGKKPYANRNFIAYDVPLAARCLAGIRFTLYKIKKITYIYFVPIKLNGM
jgi:hypothetical protein